MTEAEWQSCTDPEQMLDFLRQTGKASARQLRLFACACVRLVEPLLDERHWERVELAESFADKEASEQQVLEALQRTLTPLATVDHERVDVLKRSFYTSRAALTYRPRDSWLSAHEAARVASCDSACFRAWDLVGGFWSASDEERWGQDFQGAVAVELEKQTTLLRDIVGEWPFRERRAAPPQVLSPDVVGFAQRIYDNRDFSSLPLLGDLLEERGCDDAELLNHLRSGGVHVKGCWALDVVLGR